MKTYELVCAFRAKEGQDVSGIESVKEILGNAEAEIQSEEDMGNRELAYEINKENRAQYRLFIVKLDQTVIQRIEEALKLRTEILRFLFVVQS